MKKVIFQPVSPFIITQKFGENKVCIATDGSKRLISCDGLNPPTNYKSLYGPLGHKGVDLYAKHGQDVRAVQDGVVYMIDTSAKSGLDVRIEHLIDGIKFRTIYEHLLGYDVRVGQKITAGQLIGWADNTGYSSGDHLHFEMLIWSGTHWVQVNPLDYMTNVYALQALKTMNLIAYIRQVIAHHLDNAATNLRK